MKFSIRNSRFPARSRKAFTLVEIMTATAIMLVLIMFTTRIASDMLRAYNNTVSKLTANMDSRAVLDPICEDFNALFFPSDGKFWFEARYDEDDQGNLSGDELPQIFFFSQARDRIHRTSDGNNTEELPATVAAISYHINQTSPFGSSISSAENLSYIFYRSTLNTRDTASLAMGYVRGNESNLENPDKQIPSAFWKSAEQITDPTDNKKYNMEKWRSDLQNYTCDGVVNMTFVFWYDDFSDGKRKIAVAKNAALESKIREAFPENEITVFSKSLAAASDKIMFDGQSARTTNGALRAIDVSVTLLDQAGRELLLSEQRQRNSGKIDDERFKNILREYGTTYTRTIKINL